MAVQKYNGSSLEGCKAEDDEEYDPHKNRQLDDPNTSVETLLHILKGCLGTGILAMPEAFKYSGFAGGIVGTILIGAFNAYCFHVLIGSQYIICKRRKVAVMAYPESMKCAFEMGPNFFKIFASYATYVITALIVCYQIGSCSVYVLFVGENMKRVFDTYLTNEISLTNYMLMSLIPFYLIACVKNLKVLAIVSLLGNVICVGSYIAIAYYAAQDLKDFQDLNMVGKVTDFPLFFGTAMFSLQSLGVMTTAENNMKNPKTFRKPIGVLHIGMFLIVTVYILIGGIGYWSYGDEIQSSITLNFPTDQPSGQAIRLLNCLAIYISYSINMFVVFDLFWKGVFESRLENSSDIKKSAANYLHRFFWVLVTFALAILVPFLGLLISFLGCFNICLLLFVFPALMQICVLWPEQLGWKMWVLWKNLAIIVFGVFAFFAGTYSPILEISHKYK